MIFKNFFLKIIKGKKIRFVLLVFIAFLFSYFLLKENLTSKLGLIDDHEIALYLGVDHRLTVSEIFPILKQAFISDFSSLRFRFVYLLIRVLETFFFGNNMFLFYLSRIFLMSINFIFMSLFVGLIFNLGVGVLFSFYILSFPFWGDVYARIGPAEAYAATAFFIFCFYFLKILKKSNSLVDYLLLSSSYLIAIGSKENMFFLIIPMLYLLFKNKKNKLIFFSVIASITLFMLIGFQLKLAHVDFYGRPSSMLFRLLLFKKSFPNLISYLNILPISSCMMLFFLLGIKFKSKDLKMTIEVFLFAIVVSASQIVIYLNDFNPPRYLFPYAIIPIYILLLCSYILKKYIKKQKVYTMFIVFVILISINIDGYKEIVRIAQNNKLKTNNFNNHLSKIIDISNKNRDLPIIIDASPNTFEETLSINRILAYNNVKNKRYIYQNFSLKNMTGQEKKLGSQLIKLGKSSKIFAYNEPHISAFVGETNKCIFVSFKTSPAIGNFNCTYDFTIIDY